MNTMIMAHQFDQENTDINLDVNMVKQNIKTSIFDKNGFEKSLLKQIQNKGDKTNE